MAAPNSVVFKHWARIIKAWPVDRVRPAHVHFQKVMQSRVQKLQSPSAPASNVKSNDALVTPAEPFNEQKELRQLNALYALLENRFEKEFATPLQVRHPKTKVSHYDDLVKELDEAPNRSWFTNVWNRIKGSVRMQ